MDKPTNNLFPPHLDGLVWRLVGIHDLPTLTDLAGACLRVDGGLDFQFESEVVREIFFPDTAVTGIGAFKPGGQMVACTTVHAGGESVTRRAVTSGFVHPELRNLGIGRFLIGWSQVQACTLLPASIPGKLLLQIKTESLGEPANRLYCSYGFKSVFEELVERRDIARPLPDFRLPSDVSITTWQPGLAGKFFQAYDAAFRERPGFPGYAAAEWVDSWTTDHFKPNWSLLASIGDLPVGFLLATTNPPNGFVMQVGVIPAQRRRGLASGLIVESMRRMLADGCASVQLLVHTNNPGAIQAYEKLGFVTVGRRARYEKILD